MTWQTGTATGYQNLLTQIVQLATSQHISAATVSAGGSGYTNGDILTISHASGTHTATFEATVSAGAVTSVRVVTGGAFSRRVATAAVNAGGSGYPVSSTVFVSVNGGTSTQKCKLSCTTNGSGVVTAVTIIEGGGAYTADPATTGAATTTIGPNGVTGSGLTVNLTMQAIIGTSSIATTGGTGTGATLNLTLTATGWNTSTGGRDTHDFSINGVTSEKEVIMQGTVSGGDEPYIGFRTWTSTSGITNFNGVLLTAMDTHNPSLAFTAQQNIIPSSGAPSTSQGAYVPMLTSGSSSFWISLTGRRIRGEVKVVGGSTTVYHSFYSGLLSPYGTATENPYPLFVAGSTSGTQIAADAGAIDATGLTEAFRHSSRTGPIYYRRPVDGSWQQVFNGSGTAFPVTANTTLVIYPIGEPDAPDVNDLDDIIANGNFTWFNSVGRNTGAAPTLQLRPTPNAGNDLFALIPATVLRAIEGTSEFDVHGELDGVFWISATKSDGTSVVAEDTLTVGTTKYRIFPCSNRTERYSFLAMTES